MDVPSTKPLWVRAGAATASSALFAATLGVAGCAGGSGSLRAGTQTVSPSDFRDAGEVQADAQGGLSWPSAAGVRHLTRAELREAYTTEGGLS